MKNFNPIKKLLTGAILLAFGIFMIYTVGEKGVDRFEKSIFLFFNDYFSKNTASLIAIVSTLALAWFSFKAFIKGGYRVLTFSQHLETFDDGLSGRRVIVKNNGLYPNINRALEYREAKMAGMNDRDAADFLNSTAKLDSLYSGYSSGANTQRALNFVESRMAGMNSEKAVEYLQGKIR